MVLEHAARRWGIGLIQEGRALQGRGRTSECSVLLALPLIWMNQTGEVVQSLLEGKNLSPSDLILVYDDLDLPLGALKIKTRGGPGGHNGLRSVLSSLGTENFCRLKVGIGRPPLHENPADYVLASFSREETDQVDILLPKVVNALECVIEEGIPQAMNRFHSSPLLPEVDESCP